jgi:hypothetical protein
LGTTRNVYDPLTGYYSLSCPHRGEARLRLSSFRALDRLPGPSTPAVFSVLFACPCGEEHPGLVAHDELDVAPLGLGSELTFRNVLTARDDPVGEELADLAATRIGAGEWPWSFFCYLESRPRSITPSAIARMDDRGLREDGLLAVAVRCPACETTSVNVVTHHHVDVPFWNDPCVAVADHVFPDEAVRAADGFREELEAAGFDERRLAL